MTESRQQPNLIILAGPNGSGKTTFAQLLQADDWGKNCRILNADLVAESLGSWNDTSCIVQAQKLVREELYHSLEQGIDVMYETVFSHPSKLDIIKHALKLGYFIRLFFICTQSPRINLERIAERYADGGHTVPGDKVMNRYNRALLYGAEAMRLVQRGYLYDNTALASAGKAAFQLIFRTINGEECKLYIDPDNMPPTYRFFWEDYIRF